MSRAYGCTLIPLHRPSCPQIWGFRFTWGVEMMPQHHVWGWYPPQTASYIHIRHIKSVWDIDMLSQGHMVAPLYRYTGQVAPRFGKSGSLEEWKWCHNVIVEAGIHLRLLYASIVDIYKVFEPLVCCLRGIWLHPYTVTPAKFALGLLANLKKTREVKWACWVEVTSIMSVVKGVMVVIPKWKL